MKFISRYSIEQNRRRPRTKHLFDRGHHKRREPLALHNFQNANDNRPFVPYPNANDKWKPVSSSNDNFETNKILMKQVASHNTIIQELNKFVASISSDIKGLQLEAAWLDKALSKLADNQATLLSMSAGKPQAPHVVGLNSINIAENVPLTLVHEKGHHLDKRQFNKAELT